MLPKPWDIVSSERRDSLRIFGLRVDRAVSPRTGATHDFYVLESDSWVNVIPITPEREVVLIHQYRHGTREVTLEIPRLIREGGITHALMVTAFYRLFMEHLRTNRSKASMSPILIESGQGFRRYRGEKMENGFKRRLDRLQTLVPKGVAVRTCILAV